MTGDRVIYELRADTMVKVAEPRKPQKANFVIVSHFGRFDWSGFRTLGEIEPQLPSLKDRPDGFYQVVER